MGDSVSAAVESNHLVAGFEKAQRNAAAHAA